MANPAFSLLLATSSPEREDTEEMGAEERQEERSERNRGAPKGSAALLPADCAMGTGAPVTLIFDTADFKWRSLHIY